MLSLLSVITVILVAASLNGATAKPSTSGQTRLEPFITSSAKKGISFGSRYAALFLDYTEGLATPARKSSTGRAFLNASAVWSHAVHNASASASGTKSSGPAIIAYSRLYFASEAYHEVMPGSGFANVIKGQNFTDVSGDTKIVDEVKPHASDLVVKKTRYDAAWQNEMIGALRAQKVDTVVLSGLRTSGVILNTAFTLFNADFDVIVISNTTYETPPNTKAMQEAILGKDGIISKLPAKVITLDEALEALSDRS